MLKIPFSRRLNLIPHKFDQQKIFRNGPVCAISASWLGTGGCLQQFIELSFWVCRFAMRLQVSLGFHFQSAITQLISNIFMMFLHLRDLLGPFGMSRVGWCNNFFYCVGMIGQYLTISKNFWICGGWTFLSGHMIFAVLFATFEEWSNWIILKYTIRNN